MYYINNGVLQFMGHISVVIPDDLEDVLRKDCHRKGDMSNRVTKALKQYYVVT